MSKGSPLQETAPAPLRHRLEFLQIGLDEDEAALAALLGNGASGGKAFCDDTAHVEVTIGFHDVSPAHDTPPPGRQSIELSWNTEG